METLGPYDKGFFTMFRNRDFESAIFNWRPVMRFSFSGIASKPSIPHLLLAAVTGTAAVLVLVNYTVWAVVCCAVAAVAHLILGGYHLGKDAAAQ